MPEATPTTAPAAAPSVAVAVPAAAPQPTANAAVTPIPAAAAEPAPAAAVSSTVQPAKAAPAVIPSLIGDDAPADGAKPADAKPADPAQPADPAAVVYDIKLPDGVTLDAPQMDVAKGLFAKAKATPEVAQEFADFHVGELTKLKTQMENNQIDAWNGYISAKQAEVMADPVIGGAKFPEAKTRIESGLKTFFGITDATPVNDPARKAHADFLGVLKYTGAGSTLPMLRLLDKIASPRSEGRPAPAGQPSVPKTSPAEKFYGKRAAAE